MLSAAPNRGVCSHSDSQARGLTAGLLAEALVPHVVLADLVGETCLCGSRRCWLLAHLDSPAGGFACRFCHLAGRLNQQDNLCWVRSLSDPSPHRLLDQMQAGMQAGCVTITEMTCMYMDALRSLLQLCSRELTANQ